MKINLHDNTFDSLISDFNKRDKSAFSTIYTMVFDELYCYAGNLLDGTNIEPEDQIHDIFVKLWLDKNTKFESITHIKNYLYLSVRNKFSDYISHKKHVNDYELQVKRSEDYHISNMIESEVVSAINEAISILPAESAKVFKLYVEGWDIKEIASKLNKTPSTIYKQKDLAISILRRKLTSKNFLIITHFI